MDLSKAKGLYVGNTPVKYAWFNGRRVWPQGVGNDEVGLLLTGNTYVPYVEVVKGTRTITKDEVVGITFRDELNSFIMAPENVGPFYFCGANILKELPEGLPPDNLTGPQIVTNSKYGHGKEYTDILYPYLSGGPEWAVPQAKSYVFKDGTPGYLGSPYEYGKIQRHYDEINEMAAKVGLDELFPGDFSHRYWTSVLCPFNGDTRWVWIWSGPSYVDGGHGQGQFHIRPLGAFMTAEDEEKIRESLVLWYDPARQGATNENMAANPVLKDLTGNGHDATLYNFAWTEMSGVNTDDNGVNILFDGKDDYGKVERLPLFTAEPGYTILIKRKYYTNYQLASKSKIASTGAFYFDSISVAASFNKITRVAIPTTLVIWQTAHKSNGEDIVPGTAEDSDTMWIGTIRDGDARLCRMNLYSLLLFDRDLTNNEIEWVKKNMIEGEGVMKYDWARRPWNSYLTDSGDNRGTGSVTSYRLTVNAVRSSARVLETAVSLPSMQSYRIKVSNLPEGVNIKYSGVINGRETEILSISKDGIYEIPPIEEESINVGFRFDKTFENENLIIQQLLS